jgi:NAD-dependent SIR2 family protein deacetylase
MLTDPPKTCTQCHGVEQWQMPDFDHDARTSYKLEGAHRRVPCLKCHKTEQIKGQSVIVYRETPKLCEYCHGGLRPSGDVVH